MARKPRVRFLPADVVVTLDSPGRPRGDVGEPGSLLDLALAHGVPLDHTCGGLASCATCHCVVLAGAGSIPPPGPAELAQLVNAVGRRPGSRLACQAVPDGTADVVVEIPDTGIATPAP